VSEQLLLVAHGTRDPAGATVTEAVAEQVRGLLGVRVAVCYADVRYPTPAEALAELPGPAVAVPMFLAAGYHVRVDVPAQLAATGRADVLLAETFGPDPLLVTAAASRLRAAGLRDGDAVVLAAIGSSDPCAQADGATAARRLARELRAPVTLATIAMGAPRVPEAVAQLRADGAERVAVASWLLAPGLFQRALVASGADVVADPLATHEAVPRLVVARYTAALAKRTSVA
jgi:sirohydrochlorin ferrochelatase